MAYKITPIENGTITSPKGFKAAGIHAGIKSSGKLDLGLLVSDVRCSASGVFTTNVIKGASLLVNREHLQDGYAQAILANSGNANACTGEIGIRDAEELSASIARSLGISAQDVLPNSTGVIGEFLPMPRIRAAIADLVKRLRYDGGEEMARAIMTTDTVPKSAARRVEIGGFAYTLGGVAKGAGMIHPNMATMFGFLTTDARIHPKNLHSILQDAVDVSFNRLTIDGDTSCDDTVLLLANGQAGGEEIHLEANEAGEAFRAALSDLCLDLTRQLARDGEGVTKVVTIQVRGAQKKADATQIARSVAVSCLGKCAIHGQDPNWGRFITAAGYSGVAFDPNRVDLWIGDVQVVSHGAKATYEETDAAAVMKSAEFAITLDMHQGDQADFYLTTDLSHAYIDINADYRHRT